MLRAGIALGIFLLCLAAAACGSSDSAPEDEATATLLATRTPSGPRAQGILSVLQASCRLLQSGAEISIEYGASARSGVLTRVKLVKDGLVIEDSGNIETPSWRHSTTYQVNGGTHFYQVQIDAGSLKQSSRVNVVRCPAVPPAQRI